jgi:hypothetical protein
MNYLAAVYVFHRLLVGVYQIDDGSGLARPWRTIEQNIGEIFLLEHVEENLLVIGVEYNVFKLGGAVFLAPWLRFFVGSAHWANIVVNFIWFMRTKGSGGVRRESLGRTH